MHEIQRHRAHDLLRSKGLDRALFAHLDSVKWLTGYAPQVQLGGNHFAGGPALVWYEDRHFTLIVLDMDVEAAGTFGNGADETLWTYPGYAFETPTASPERLIEALDRLTASSTGGPIGIERHALPTHLYERIQERGRPIGIDRLLVPLRMVKTDHEIALLKRNFALTDLGHRTAAASIRPGVREIDVWTDVHRAINREAGHRVPLGNDCVVGYRSPNNIGGWPRDLPLHEGASLIVDLSTAFRGYWSDSCNVYYAGTPDDQQRTLRRIVQEALDFAMSLVKPGVPVREIDQRVRGFIEKAGYPAYPHHTGHGVGVSVHEEPRITPYNDTPLEPNMMIMLEPGIYLPGETGCRLEHGLLVTQDGGEVLTTHIEPV